MNNLREQDSPDREEKIMYATYRVLQDHGYSNLTMERIAEEYGKSTAAIHYYYDTKEDLIFAFLDYLIDQFHDMVRDVETTDPGRRLDDLLDKLLVTPRDHREMLLAIADMQSRAPYDDGFADRFEQTDEYHRYLFESVIDHGISEGVFADVDSEHVARALVTIVAGGHNRSVVLDEEDPLVTARQTADEYLDAVLREDTGSDQTGD